MHLLFYSTCLLLLLTKIRANPINPEVNITEIYSSTLSNDAVVCSSPDPEHQPIYNPDCFVLENDILLSLYTRIPRLWGLIGINYPRKCRDCTINFLRTSSRGGDPLEKFPEYQIAIAAAVIVNKCSARHNGGLKYITQSQQFAAEVKNLQNAGEEILHPSPNVTETELVINSTLLSPISDPSINNTTAIAPPISNLNASVNCYPPGEQFQPINREDCYVLLHNMLLRPDILTSKAWSGRNPSTSECPWSSDSCGFEVIGRSSLAMGYFKLIDPVVAAAQVVRTCFVDRGSSFGGVISVPDQERWFSVRVASARVLAENTTSVESA